MARGYPSRAGLPTNRRTARASGRGTPRSTTLAGDFMGFGEQRDRYQPHTRLEAGLGGERWIASDRDGGPDVILAVLDARAATDAHRASFDAYRSVGMRLVHPSLERVVDVGETALGNPFFAVERAEGETLAQRLEREPAMSVHELVRVATAVVDGLAIAHKAGLVHGDIAPDRILLLGGGRARLLGFGLNRSVARTLAAAREAPILPPSDAFMSPEQAAGKSATANDDLFSLAAVLYRGVTGQAPHANDDGRSTVANLLEGPAKPTIALRPDLPASFGQLLDRALAADPAARFKDAAELRKALTSALILAPTVARLPVIAFPRGIARESTSGIDTQAPALPPPPTRSRTGIGPLGARDPDEVSGLWTLPKDPGELLRASSPGFTAAPNAEAPVMPASPPRARSSAPPPLPTFARASTPSRPEAPPVAATTDELEELDEFDELDEASRSEEFEALPAPAGAEPTSAHVEVVEPQAAPTAIETPPARLPAIAPPALTAPPDVELPPRPKAPIIVEAKRTGPLVPMRGWISIAIFALGVFVAAAGGFRWLAGRPTSPSPSATPSPGTPPRAAPAPAPTPPVPPPQPAPVLAVDAGAPSVPDAGPTLDAGVDATTPSVSPTIPPPAAPPSTPTLAPERPVERPRPARMAPGPSRSTHTLARDPGF